ncbi:hypothetical protein Cgig2_004892 [Carnegiea gigantea]|uniref:Endonuclease/exonuclease/phosphatase domain-containing protein n=1 Tax=Carnegiea gigantea TaxID=171969 RepID=A0A9Q1JEU5_9CARY|nr:hypothetical protein Cgig2_004892 [Carnegiea gigantea]
MPEESRIVNTEEGFQMVVTTRRLNMSQRRSTQGIAMAASPFAVLQKGEEDMNTFGKHSTQAYEVNNFIENNKIALLGLMGIKVKEKNFSLVCNSLHPKWVHFANYGYHPRGRISIIDSPSEALQLDSSTRFNISFVYGQNELEIRKERWKNMESFAGNTNKAWIVMGNFNDLLRNEHRIVGNKITMHEILDFRGCLEACGLEEMKWTQDPPGRVYSKIHRTFINQEELMAWGIFRLNFNQKSKLHNNPLNAALQEQESKTREEYYSIVEASLKLLRQQSKIDWTGLGDQCSNLFFTGLKQK